MIYYFSEIKQSAILPHLPPGEDEEEHKKKIKKDESVSDGFRSWLDS